MVPQISPIVAAEWLAAGEAVLLDVREPAELELAAVQGATHIPMGSVPARLSELDSSTRYAVMCHHGMRSYRVATYLSQAGFGDVHNVAGGIAAWSAEVDPSVGDY
jgi:rhodanese-related sulfurtransferase